MPRSPLHVHPVRHRAAAAGLAVHGTRLADDPRVQGQRLGQRRLAGVRVADHGEGPAPRRPRFGGGRRRSRARPLLEDGPRGVVRAARGRAGFTGGTTATVSAPGGGPGCVVGHAGASGRAVARPSAGGHRGPMTRGAVDRPPVQHPGFARHLFPCRVAARADRTRRGRASPNGSLRASPAASSRSVPATGANFTHYPPDGHRGAGRRAGDDPAGARHGTARTVAARPVTV